MIQILKNYIRLLYFIKKHLPVLIICGLVIAVGLLSLKKSSLTVKPVHAQSLTLPNIVLIVTDDQTAESVAKMPYVSGRTDWINFTNAFFNVSLCCPSRASILTGQYSHHTGVETNNDASKFKDANTLATWLHAAGYKTSLIGKYLNGYPWKGVLSTYIPPGWDNWEVFSGATDYYNYKLNENGVIKSYGTTAADYSTDVFASKAKTFIQNQTGPFFLMLTPYAPHSPWTPAPRYNTKTASVGAIPRFPDFNEADVSDKPLWVQSLPLLTATGSSSMDKKRRQHYQTLLAVDDMVRDVFDALQTNGGGVDNTVVIFMTDNGYSFGEHRFLGKICVYEECMRTPFLVRYPGQAGRTVSELIQNVDIASTLTALAGTSPTISQDGLSLIPLLENQFPSWRTGLLMHWIGGSNGTLTIPGFWAIRTSQYKYSELTTGEKELYDIIADPYELQNQASQSAYTAIRNDLVTQLQQLKGL